MLPSALFPGRRTVPNSYLPHSARVYLAHAERRGTLWLRQGERDRGAEEAENFPLDAGWLGEHWHGGPGASEPDLVTGWGCQVVQQAAEAARGRSGRPGRAGVWGAWAAAERRAGATGLSCWGGLWSVKVSAAQAWRRYQVR